MPDPNIVQPPESYGDEVWYDYNDFAVEHGIDTDEAISVLRESTFILSELTDGVLHGPKCWRDEYRVPAGYMIDLYHGPVTAIIGVYKTHDCGTVEEEVTDTSCLISDHTVDVRNSVTSWNGFMPGEWLPWGFSCNCRNYNYAVEYTQASTLVPGSDRVAKKLAEEYLRARAGKPCALPERITSVSRQGMSWTILDPQDFLTKGLTGISVVDHWLSIVKRRTNGLKMRDPLRGALLKSVPMDCTTEPFA